MPYLIEDGEGKIHANDWAKGFLAATHLRFDVWAEIVNDEERSGPFVPMWALAYENSEEPITVKIVTPVGGQKRQEKPVIGCFLACSICFEFCTMGANSDSLCVPCCFCSNSVTTAASLWLSVVMPKSSLAPTAPPMSARDAWSTVDSTSSGAVRGTTLHKIGRFVAMLAGPLIEEP
jgi:hypothetical protein